VLFAIALIFSQTCTLNLSQVHVSMTPLTIVAGALFIIVFGVRIAFVRTYTWLPDAYTQAPGGISALISGIVTISGIVALLRAISTLDSLSFQWGAVLIGFGTLNIIVGNMGALRQEKIKRLFAYSSITHIGFILTAVGIGVFTGEVTGFHGGMLHLSIHALMKALAFFTVGAIGFILSRADSSLRVSDLEGVGRREPLLAIALAVACLSLAGIPPLAGFMSKWLIFDAGLQAGGTTLLVLMIIAALNSVFSLSYYLPVINALFQDTPTAQQHRLPTAMRLPILILTGAILILGIYPTLLDGIIHPASAALMQLFGG